jgi:PAS domain S-box-containing protein
LNNEIAEREKTEQEFNRIFDLSNDLICTATMTHFIRINPAGEKILGYTQDELRQIPFIELIHPDDVEPTRITIENELKKGKSAINFANRYRHKDGHYRWLEWVTYPDIEKGMLYAIARDITERKKNERKLLVQAQMIDILKDSLVSTDLDGFVTTWNKGAEKIFKYTSSEAVGQHISFVYPLEEHDNLQKIIAQLKKMGQHETEVRMHKKSGEIFHAILSCSMIYDENGTATGMLGYSIDITERKQTEKALAESHEQFLKVLNGLDAIVYVADMETYEILFANRYVTDIFGDIRGSTCWKNLQSGQEGPCEFCTNRHLIDADGNPMGVYKWEFQNTVNGCWYDIRDRAIHWPDGRIVRMEIANDITSLKQALSDKEMLIREVYHRTKNNLGVVQSLLSLQSRHISDEASRAYFVESQNRVRSMSLIHESLYRADDLKSINFSEYVEKLSRQLFNSYSVSASRVALNINVPEILLDVDTMIPCGLIINELVSNVFKHAFPDEMKGELCIELSEGADKQYMLVIRDNGVGIPTGLDINKTESLGMQSLNALTRQINGKLDLSTENGTEIRITFREKVLSGNHLPSRP